MCATFVLLLHAGLIQRDSKVLLVNNYELFLQAFNDIKHNSRLFVFLLFDERPTHGAMARFVSDRFEWLNSLADAADVYCFAHKGSHSAKRNLQNPSLKIARDFGIAPGELPGVLAFSVLPKSDQIGKGAYLSLRIELFEGDPQKAEDFFAGLFSVFRSAQEATQTPAELLARLRDDFSAVKRKEFFKPAVNVLVGSLKDLTKLPEKILLSVAEGLGKAIGGKIAGG
jgi:hypothetical protein